MIVFGSPSRYVQGPGALAGLGRELARMGGAVALLVDPVMQDRHGETIRATCDEAGIDASVLTFGGESTWAEVDRLEGLLTTGYEKIVMDADRCSAMMRFVQGVDFSETAQAMEAFREVPPGGHFLGASHTQAHFETAFWMGDMSDNGTFEQWSAEGALWEHERANLRVKKILAEYEPPAMDIAQRDALDDFVARRTREIMGDAA